MKKNIQRRRINLGTKNYWFNLKYFKNIFKYVKSNVKKNIREEFRLQNIDETRNCFLEEI